MCLQPHLLSKLPLKILEIYILICNQDVLYVYSYTVNISNICFCFFFIWGGGEAIISV